MNYQAQNLLAEARIEAASTMYRIRSKRDLQGLQLVVIFLGGRSSIETKFQLLPTSSMCQRCGPGLEHGINGPAANSFTILQTLQAFASFLTFSSTQTPPHPLHWTWPCAATGPVVAAIPSAAAIHSAARVGYRLGCWTLAAEGRRAENSS